MKKERRSRKQIKNDMNLCYSSMEAKVSEKAKAIFKRKAYT